MSIKYRFHNPPAPQEQAESKYTPGGLVSAMVISTLTKMETATQNDPSW